MPLTVEGIPHIYRPALPIHLWSPASRSTWQEESWDLPVWTTLRLWAPGKAGPSRPPGHLASDSQARGGVPRISPPRPDQLPTGASSGDKSGAWTGRSMPLPRPGSRDRRGLGEASGASGWGSSCVDFRKPGWRSACNS